MTQIPSLAPQDVGIQKARPLDLFFDLVFVFAVSQITGLIAHPHNAYDYLQALLAGMTIAFMYNAFIWLTGNTNLDDDYSGYLLLLAMGGFFVLALSVSSVRGQGGIAFGFALLMLNLIHTFMFSKVQNSSSQAIQEVAPFNLFSTLCVLYAAFASGIWHWVLWIAALLVYAIPMSRRSTRAYTFSLSPLHFIERHGLLIIIALGESIMGMGLGGRELPINLTLLAYVSLGLLLASTLWWSYFGPDNARAEHNMLRASPQERVILAANMGITHFVILFGIMFTAAALEVGIHHPTQPAPAAAAWNLGLGVCLFYVGEVFFRRVMGIGPGRLRSALAVAALLTIPIGLHYSAMWQLLACALLNVLVTYIEDYVLEPKREAAGHS